ncbi:MAG: BMC domain-containing protein [Tetragenococcus halophilus]|uniref:BMC domain-containing protein n=1 Tax=Tetragenococcus halophilus TaxID=51669 RepID=UPI00077C9F37|nr:BMC domain-containing protein [Tetragenococcus halophilus]MDN6625973.1 BMC domain-containing protein [Pisciglobus halotolerans]MCF1601992.1 BMC domain-containing protein [Tetragenococcus halophilus]MCO8288974.1 BMC domain-containing protein [Tetragenococcus halophilus]MDN6126958.1 BMC domain-containing protein [Tetragenococcus halophilus]MDN6723264.1 BMC domain-containing protein [Tetragenococcus halophilus]
MKALGMIEVRGYLGAVSATDAALKAADVELNNAEVIRGGLTTVELIGDVAAVKAAVDAGAEEAQSLNCLITQHVIARVDEQTKIVTTSKNKPEINGNEQKELVVEDTSKKDPPSVPENNSSESKETLKEQLAKEKVVELRKRAYQMNITALKKSEIKTATKKDLIEAIAAEAERSE